MKTFGSEFCVRAVHNQFANTSNICYSAECSVDSRVVRKLFDGKLVNNRVKKTLTNTIRKAKCDFITRFYHIDR